MIRNFQFRNGLQLTNTNLYYVLDFFLLNIELLKNVHGDTQKSKIISFEFCRHLREIET